MPTNTGYLGSNQTSDYVSNMSQRSPVWMFSTLSTLGAARFGSTLSVDGALTVQGASTLVGAVTLSGAIASASAISGGAGTFTTLSCTQLSCTSVDFASLLTAANSSGMTNRELRLVFAASGMSLVYSSGATVYTIGASAVSAAQA